MTAGGGFWEMVAVTLSMVFCGTAEVSAKEEWLEWSVADKERNGEKGLGRFGREQICRLKIRKMKEEWAKDLVARTWCISEVSRPTRTALNFRLFWKSTASRLQFKMRH